MADKVVKSERGVARPAHARAVPRHPREGHRAGVHRRLPRHQSAGRLPLRLLRAALVRCRHQVRLRHRLAELLRADRRGRGGVRDRSQPRHGAHRGAVQPLRCASRPRVSRRPRADRPALLHELGGAQAGARRTAASGDARIHAGHRQQELLVLVAARLPRGARSRTCRSRRCWSGCPSPAPRTSSSSIRLRARCRC